MFNEKYTTTVYGGQQCRTSVGYRAVGFSHMGEFRRTNMTLLTAPPPQAHLQHPALATTILRARRTTSRSRGGLLPLYAAAQCLSSSPAIRRRIPFFFPALSRPQQRGGTQSSSLRVEPTLAAISCCELCRASLPPPEAMRGSSRRRLFHRYLCLTLPTGCPMNKSRRSIHL
jgi:hypothetical protein